MDTMTVATEYSPSNTVSSTATSSSPTTLALQMPSSDVDAIFPFLHALGSSGIPLSLLELGIQAQPRFNEDGQRVLRTSNDADLTANLARTIAAIDHLLTENPASPRCLQSLVTKRALIVTHAAVGDVVSIHPESPYILSFDMQERLKQSDATVALEYMAHIFPREEILDPR